ncbi:hypothetical protein OE88DRAFT_1684365 [Heliocybe sulcata]|uniref:Uncharacterized protein n=1 Tax=Heliocybe sulcata TaxID=5364 RepID=A0A5C3N3J1_9AGAM|nr:hypothetical protein OE88DRAFT_1684365 [Heliocybe sulcata]
MTPAPEEIEVDPTCSSEAGDLNSDVPAPYTDSGTSPEALPASEEDFDTVSLSSDLPAFREMFQVRLAYLQAMDAHINDGLTEAASTRKLLDSLDIISSFQSLPNHPKPAKSLVTVKRRLGLHPDDFIIQYPICTSCYKHYSRDKIDLLPLPKCQVKKCKGIVYREKRYAGHPKKGEEYSFRRVPAKIQPYSPLIPAVRRFLMRPDFIANLRDTSCDSQRSPIPDDEPMKDIYDGTGWSGFDVGLKRTVRHDGGISDIEVAPGSRQRLVDCDVGLNMAINMDWFGITENRPHSAGGVYIVFNNLSRSIRFLECNVHLVTTIPGPKEPSLEQLNHTMEPLKDEIKLLYAGKCDTYPHVNLCLVMDMYGHRIPPQVHCTCGMKCSDIPASRKGTGAAGHSHKTHPCNVCHVSLDEINLPSGYDIDNFMLRNDFVQLRHAERSRTAKTKKERTAILDEHGSRYSCLNDIPGWRPIQNAPLDPMHNIYGIVAHFHASVIVAGYLLNAAQWRSYEKYINNIIWPSTIGRLPTNLSEQHSLQKCDEWRRWCNIQPTILWLCWRDDSGNIPDISPPIPRQSTSQPTWDRSLCKVYKLALYLSVAERILAAREISMNEVRRGQRYMRLLSEGLIELGVSLTINYHLAMHYERHFRRYGPAYGWWLFPYERFNNILEDVNLNGHASGEMELTLLRHWVMKQRLHELARLVPEDASPMERNIVKRILTRECPSRGTLETQLASFAAGTADGAIRPPKGQKQLTNLHKLKDKSIYGMLLVYCQKLWPDIHIIDDLTPDPNATMFVGARSARMLPFIYKDGIRYGCSTAVRTQADCFACIDFPEFRAPCELLYHFELTLRGRPSVLAPTTDLGIHAVYHDLFEEAEVVATTNIAAPVAVIPTDFAVAVPGNAADNQEHRYLSIVHSFDRTGIEPDEEWMDEAEQDFNEQCADIIRLF